MVRVEKPSKTGRKCKGESGLRAHLMCATLTRVLYAELLIRVGFGHIRHITPTLPLPNTHNTIAKTET